MNRVATSILAFEGDGKVVRYPGNYDTYRSLRPEPAIPTKAPPPKREEKPAAAGPARKALTYAERIELEGLLDRVTESEEKLRAIEAKLSERFDAEKARSLQAEHSAAEEEVRRLTARWEELEAKKT